MKLLTHFLKFPGGQPLSLSRSLSQRALWIWQSPEGRCGVVRGRSGCQQQQQVRQMSSAQRKPQSQRDLVEAKERASTQLTMGEKVKEGTKTATYTGVILLGVGVTGLMFYAIGRELFSSQSPSGVFGKALKLCKHDLEVIEYLGTPIKGYGETTRRGRRRHVSHTEFLVDGEKHMRMKFYLEGSNRKATAHLEVKQNSQGKYEYRYLFVELDDHYPRKTIILEDNR